MYDCPFQHASFAHKFTGKERDSESGLDYFVARYLSSAQGRWLSPDWAAKPQPVPYADLKDPQSLNLYAYVRNRPLFKADPDGHCPWCPIVEEAVESPAGQAAEQFVEKEGEAIAARAEPYIAEGGQMAGRALARSGQWLEQAAQQFTEMAKNGQRILEGVANGASIEYRTC